MAGRPKSIDDSKIFDISKPGKSRPMGTSRPVIINHGAMVKDPTVIDAEKPEVLSAPSVSRKIISPVTVSDAPEEAITVVSEAPGSPEIAGGATEVTESTDTTDSSSAPSQEKIDEPAATIEVTPEEGANAPETEEQTPVTTLEEESTDTIPTEAEPAPEIEDEPDTEDIEPPAGSDSASVDVLASASEKKKLSAKDEEERVKREADLQELINNKKYFLPIDHDSGSSRHVWLWFVLFIFILLGGTYIAIDAGVLDVGIDVPYNIV